MFVSLCRLLRLWRRLKLYEKNVSHEVRISEVIAVLVNHSSDYNIVRDNAINTQMTCFALWWRNLELKWFGARR